MGVVWKKAIKRSVQEFNSYEFGNGTEGEREKRRQSQRLSGMQEQVGDIGSDAILLGETRMQ